MISRTLLSLACAALLAGGDAADALRLPAGGPDLATAAAAWSAADLLALLDDADPARRRGAARLAAALPVPAETLCAALVANADPEVRRLGAVGLRGADLPLAQLARIADTDVLAALLVEHPAADPLADPAIAPLVEMWLSDAVRCDAAARLIAVRGSAVRWGEPLIKALAHADGNVVAAAHGSLQALTRIQRSLDAYAGDRRLLAQDWRDALAAKPPPARPDADLMALVAELPAPAALTALLERGDIALAAIERAQADAPPGRRRDLEAAARLVAHAVPAALLGTLGAAAFADLDHADPAQRIACLRRVAAVARERADPGGPGMLIAALDDGDSAVRATALDQLVRLSDETKRFKKPWRISDKGLFHPDAAKRRLRRCLRDGSPDEQIAALLFLGSVECKELTDDVIPLILAPRDDVVDTALESLSRLEPGPSHIPAISRLADDPHAPGKRRIAAAKVLGALMERGRWNSEARSSSGGALGPLIRLSGDKQDAIALAATAALAKGDASGAILRTALAKLFERGLATEAMAIADDLAAPEVVSLVATRVEAGGPDAEAGALGLLDGLCGYDDKRRAATTTALASPALRAALAAPGRTGPGCAALAAHLRLIPLDVALPRIIAAEALRDRCLATLAQAADAAGLLAIGAVLPAKPSESHVARSLRNRVLALVARSPERLSRVVSLGQGLLQTNGSESSSRDKVRTRTLKLRDGGVIKLETPSPSGRDYDDDDELPWTLVGAAPPGTPDAAQTAALVAMLAGLVITDADEIKARDLALVWIRNEEPPATLATAWQSEDDLCKLLATQFPAFRTAVIDRILADTKPEESNLWSVRPWLKMDPLRLVPLALSCLAADDDPSEYQARPIIAAMRSLPADQQATLLPLALAVPVVAQKLDETLAENGPLPLTVVLILVEGRGLGTLQIAPIADSAADALFDRFVAWTIPQVLARSGSVRRLRTSGAPAVDAALRRLIARQDATAAAWLRGGVPAEAGMLDAYRAAENATVPELALVGSAMALKESRLTPADFLARIATWPSAVQIDAAAAAKRYAEGRWPELAVPAGTLVARLGARALPAWLAILPPEDAIIAALAERAADPATAEAMGGTLASRLARDAANWREPALRIIARANGRLDWIKPGPVGK